MLHIIYENLYMTTALDTCIRAIILTAFWSQIRLGEFTQEAVRVQPEADPILAKFWLTQRYGFHTLPSRVKQVLDISKVELLAALAYPLENKDVLRAGCDLMGLFLIYDEYTDAATPHEARQLAKIVVDALQHPDKARPAGECIVAEITRQFWQSSSKCALEGSRDRFIKAFRIYTIAVAQETHDRVRNITRNIEDYILFRRSTAAMKATFMPIQFDLNLPDEVFEDPVIQRLTDACADLCTLVNVISGFSQHIDFEL
ncbi:Epi-isozizaene synthase [Termitomyces sp. T112]|nr:Epi-isozizaene synthase [Termitomyces sp. T112]